jgi:N-acetylmuramoyl-L-alanine amidase
VRDGEQPAAEAPAKPADPSGVVTTAGVVFKVQVATSSKRIPLQPRNFNGIADVEEHKGAGLYKYTVGNEPDLDAARRRQQECKDKGFAGAFIVAFKDGERIDLQEAVKLARGR